MASTVRSATEGHLVLPFQRGTFSTEDHSRLCGKTYVVLDSRYGSNVPVILMLVKNESTIELAAKKLCRFSTTAGEYGLEVDGYTTVSAEDHVGVVDDLLTETVDVNGYFYVVVDGPALCLMPETAASAGPVDTTIGARLVAATAAASTQTTDAGAIATRNATLSATGVNLALWLENVVGRALSVKATTQTGESILVWIGK